MNLIAWIIVGWVFACCLVTFAWCVLVDVCQRRARKHSGSSSTRLRSESESVPTVRPGTVGTPHLKIVP